MRPAGSPGGAAAGDADPPLPSSCPGGARAVHARAIRQNACATDLVDEVQVNVEHSREFVLPRQCDCSDFLKEGLGLVIWLVHGQRSVISWEIVWRRRETSTATSREDLSAMLDIAGTYNCCGFIQCFSMKSAPPDTR